MQVSRGIWFMYNEGLLASAHPIPRSWWENTGKVWGSVSSQAGAKKWEQEWEANQTEA